MDFSNLTVYLDSLESRYGVPACDCIVTKDHETVYRHLTGYADYGKKVPLKDNALFRLFSGTKVITMTAVMQLVEQNKLGLYDELASYIPEFGRLRVADRFEFSIPIHWPTNDDPCHLAQNSIRIIDLMTMTAGMNYNTEAKELAEIRERTGSTASTQDVVKAMAQMPLVYEPRARWSYGFEHDVLAAVIEIVTGISFGEYLKKNIFEPLGVSDFYFTIDETVKDRLAALYTTNASTGAIIPDDGLISAYFKVTDNYESGGAGLIGSVSAYSAVVDALANDGVGRNGARILTHDSIAMLMTPYTKGAQQKDFEMTGKVGYGYGLGVRVLTDAGKSKSSLGEFGWDGAAGAYVLADPVSRVSIFYVQHIMAYPIAYDEIHPTIRDLVYEGLGNSIK